MMVDSDNNNTSNDTNRTNERDNNENVGKIENENDENNKSFNSDLVNEDLDVIKECIPSSIVNVALNQIVSDDLDEESNVAIVDTATGIKNEQLNNNNNDNHNDNCTLEQEQEQEPEQDGDNNNNDGDDNKVDDENNDSDSDECKQSKYKNRINDDFQVKCKVCSKENSQFWREVGHNMFLCNDCFHNKLYLNLYHQQQSSSSSSSSSSSDSKNDKEIKQTSSSTTNKQETSSLLSSTPPTVNKLLHDAMLTRRLTRQSNKRQPITSTKLTTAAAAASTTTTIQVQQQNQQFDDNSQSSSTTNNEQQNQQQQQQQQELATNRRTHLFKRIKPKKTESISCTITTSEFVFHSGYYLQVDDIVKLIDETDKKAYYAQIRGFLTDQYVQKYAVITWLLPINTRKYCNNDNNNNNEGNNDDDDDNDDNGHDKFDEMKYILGPDEEFPRLLDTMQFVHRPKTNYLKRKHYLYDNVVSDKNKKYVNLLTFHCLNNNNNEDNDDYCNNNKKIMKFHRIEWNK